MPNEPIPTGEVWGEFNRAIGSFNWAEEFLGENKTALERDYQDFHSQLKPDDRLEIRVATETTFSVKSPLFEIVCCCSNGHKILAGAYSRTHAQKKTRFPISLIELPMLYKHTL